MATADKKPLNANALLAGLVDVIAGGNAQPMQFDRLALALGVEEGAAKIEFLLGVKKILRELPDKAFVDKNARLAMVDAVQEALDTAIDLEESAEDDDEPQEENNARGAR